MLVVCSQSTRNFFPGSCVKFIVKGSPNKSILDLNNSVDEAIAVGGGAVIDTAKILCNTPILCYPTTASGSAHTSHSVYWDGTRKKGIKVHIPKKVFVKKCFISSLPEEATLHTKYDALSHCLDSMWSINKTKESIRFVEEALEILRGQPSKVDLVRAGNLAGKAIEICPTTLLHSLSYPLTGFYGIPHGRALGFFLHETCKFMNFNLEEYIQKPSIEIPKLNIDVVSSEALSYNKISNVCKKIGHSDIVGIIERSC